MKGRFLPLWRCRSTPLWLLHLCLLRSQPARLPQGPGRRERATSGGLSMPPLDWCPGSQTPVDPEALPVLGELAEPDPAARPPQPVGSFLPTPWVYPSPTAHPHPLPKSLLVSIFPSLP